MKNHRSRFGCRVSGPATEDWRLTTGSFDLRSPVSRLQLRFCGHFRGGFSLVEMMVVLILIGLLASVVTINVRGYLVRGRQDTVRLELATIRDGLETYYGMAGRYPTNEEGLELLTQSSEKLPEPILSQVPVDPWGQLYQYHSPGKDNRPYEVICYGADGREGGEGADADMSNWDLRAARATAQSEQK